MTRYKIVFSSLYEKWQVKRFSPVFGWVTLEEFEEKEDAELCVERLKKFRNG